MVRIRKPRVAILSLSVAGTLVGVALVDPPPFKALGLDVWRAGQFESELRLADQHGVQLDDELLACQDR